MTRRATWAKPHAIAMTVLVVAALIVGWMLLPGDAERIAMLELDGKNREALRILETRYEAGDRRHRTLFQLQSLYEQFGDLPRARAMLERLAEARPRDAQVQRQLATFYKMTQDGPGYVQQLRAQITARYSEAACRELIALERLKAAFTEEQAAIESCRQRGYRRAEDMLRLASLQASAGNLQVASVMLRSIDDLRRLKEPADRLQLFAILLKTDQPREAQRRAVRWLRGGREEAFGLSLVEMLAEAGRHGDAIQLARQASNPGDLLSLAVADLLLETGQELAARTYLKGWLDHAQLRDAEMASQFIGVALDAQDPDLAFVGAQAFGLKSIAQQDLVALAEALAATRRTREFDILRREIEPETLAANPLLAAAAELKQGTQATTSALLRQVTVGELDAWRLALWSQLMRDTGRSATAAAALERLGVTAAPADSKAAKIVRRAKRTRRVRIATTQPALLPPGIGAAVQPVPPRAQAQRKTRTAAKVAAPGQTPPVAPAAAKAQKPVGPFEFLFK